MFDFCNGCIAPMPLYLEILPIILFIIFFIPIGIVFVRLIEFIAKGDKE